MTCTNCHKDFCQCTKESAPASKDFKALNTLRLLAKHEIRYRHAKTPNVVEIISDGRVAFALSLVSETSERRGDRLVKFRTVPGAWREVYFSEFLKVVKP